MNKILLFLLSLFPLLASANDFYIAKPGQQPAAIVVDTTDWTGVRLAARDLRAELDDHRGLPIRTARQMMNYYIF